VHADVDDSHLPLVPIDAALITNTYHELAAPRRCSRALFSAMRAGGTLVVVDRGPHEPDAATGRAHHEIAAADVERQLNHWGFGAVVRDDHFIDRAAEDDHWWLIVLRKP
jgi:hypothetical protein